MRQTLRRSITAALVVIAVGIMGAGSALAADIPLAPDQAPLPPPQYRPAPPVAQQYAYPPPPVVYAYPPPPPVIAYAPPPPPVVVVPRPYYWGGYRPGFYRGPYFARGYGRFGRPWGPPFRHW
jgi:hypothetical protein